MLEGADFSGMVYNPVGVSESELIQALKVGLLANIFGENILTYQPPEGTAVAVSYILLVYDVKSPFREIYQDSDQRKKAAAEMAGYDESMEERLAEILSLSDEVFVDFVFRLLRYQNHKEFMLLVSNEEFFWQLNHNIISQPFSTTDEKKIADIMEKKSKSLEYAEKILGNIDRIEDKIFKGDSASEKVRKIAASRPEARAIRPNDS